MEFYDFVNHHFKPLLPPRQVGTRIFNLLSLSKMTGNEIREAFIEFFKSKHHAQVRSSSLVPVNDPTILFTNAGMNQFKDFFLGNQTPDYKCAVTSQKVLRAGGKHNDLENVGRTDRHHTFFEMLGNFSFGDYFKREAILYAWEFLTVTLKVDPELLAISVFQDDDEAYDIWTKEIGIKSDKIARLGEADNFWSMGDTGPCGPCSEIHFKLHDPKGKTATQCLEADDGVYLEIWNLVFMQFNRDASGVMTPLPSPSIDTGMGLERIASVVQGKTNNYDTDLLKPFINAIAKGVKYTPDSDFDRDVNCRVIADHMRASVFLIADGVIPANEGRGYVLRRIIRRAARHGKELGYAPGFFAKLVADFVPTMEAAYPEIRESQDYIQILLGQEERRFASTLTQGMKILDELVEGLKKSGATTTDGAELFKLYDTYGFPPDLTEDILVDRGFTFDQVGFDAAMLEQKTRAKAAQNTRGHNLQLGEAYQKLVKENIKSEYVGYRDFDLETGLLALLKDGKITQTIQVGDEVELVLKQTPFYAEGGGQVGDTGEVQNANFSVQITTTQSPVTGLNLAHGKVMQVAGTSYHLKENETVRATVNMLTRKKVEANHTATHLLQASMRAIVGDHVKQAGSYVNEEKLRFDFSHYSPLTADQIADIEASVNQAIRENEQVATEFMDYDTAIQTGAMAIFGEKYGDEVRVVTAGSSSKEFCGGCHTGHTGNIGLFKIVLEEAISAGVRRIEAYTGAAAIDFMQSNIATLNQIAQGMKVGLDQAGPRFEQLQEQTKATLKELEATQQELGKLNAAKALDQVEEINGVKYLELALPSGSNLKTEGPNYLGQLGSGVVMLSISEADKVSVMILVSKDLTKTYQAGTLIKELSPLIEARGGGKPDFAQCGGTKPQGLDEFKLALRAKL